MSNVADQVLDAMEIMTNSKLGELKYDKTVQATIYKIVNLDTGEYKVRYTGNIFSAFSEDTSKKYKVDDLVYVKVPEGDFSSKKIITSLVSAKSLSYAQLQSLQNSIFEVSPDLSYMYNYNANESRGLIAGIASSLPTSYVYIYLGPSSYDARDYHGLFQQYGVMYENIQISAEFLTMFLSPHTKGNYGLEIEFYAKNNTVVSYRLDVSQFNGDPYCLSVYSPQSLVLKVLKNYLLGLKSVKFFEENFEFDKIVENGLVTNKENRTVPNLFVQNISIKWVEIRDLTDDTYYLTISAPRGIAFTSTISSLDLIGRLIYQGEDLMDESNCVCKWFERDLSVMIGLDIYDKDAGFGWRRVTKAEGKMYSVTSSMVPHSLKYKLIIVYNGRINLSAEIEIFNRTSSYTFSLILKTTGDNITILIDNTNLVGDWYLSYPDGSYEAISSARKVNSINVNEYLLYSSVTFYCAVYTSGGIYLGTLEHSIMNSESSDDVAITYQGEDSFRYDANGDVTIEDSEKERTLLVVLTWKEGYGTSYTVEWLMGGTAIGRSKDKATSPPNSMIESLWVDNYNVLHYNIKCKYRVNFNNNTLTVRIRTVTEGVYSFDKEILFLKDGDLGTNGTTYVTAIRPCDRFGSKLSGLNPLVYNNGWRSGLNFKCYVYKDGELINNDTTNYTISFKWSGSNIKINGSTNFPYNGDSLVSIAGDGSISSSSPSGDLEFYVKVSVNIIDRAHDSEMVNVYASYPIDVAVGGINYELIDIADIPSYIKYTSSGVTPSFYSNNLNYLYNGTSRNDLIVSLNPNVLTIVNRNGDRYIEPAASFLFEDKNNTESNIGVLSLRDPTGSTDARRLIHPIIMYLDTYGNEAINGWDGTSILCNDKEGHYIFAPLVGAGKKDNYNRFTGVVMGEDSGLRLSDSETSRRYKVGLFGYQNGVNTFGLLEDGTAFFGAKSGGGLIVINGTNATIRGGNGNDRNNPNGMIITLADLNPDEKSSAIKVGNGVFEVFYDGSFIASNGMVTGRIYAESGKIGGSNREGDSEGWTIDQNRLYSGSVSSHVELNSDRNQEFAIWVGQDVPELLLKDNEDNYPSTNVPFGVTRKGVLYAKNAYLRGTIISKSGTIGGWLISKNKLLSVSNAVGMASSGNLAFWAGSGLDENSADGKGTGSVYFSVGYDGKLTCSSADIQGKMTADSGKIGDWVISDGGLSYTNTEDGANVYLRPNGEYAGFKFNNWFSVNGSEMKVGDGPYPWLKVNEEGLTVGLSWLKVTSDELTIGSGKWLLVNSEGLTVRGTVEADAGTIGKWKIEEKDRTETEDGIIPAIVPAKNGLGVIRSENDTTLLWSDGWLISKNAYINGTINATKGTIGGWSINENSLSSTTTDDTKKNLIVLSPSNGITVESKEFGTIEIESTEGLQVRDKDRRTKFQVDMNGKVIALDAEISGIINIANGTFGNWGVNMIAGDFTKDKLLQLKILEYTFSHSNPYYNTLPKDITSALSWAIEQASTEINGMVNGALVGGRTNNVHIVLKSVDDTKYPGGIFVGNRNINLEETKNANFYVLLDGTMKTTGGLFGDITIDDSTIKSYNDSNPPPDTNYFLLSPTELIISGRIKAKGVSEVFAIVPTTDDIAAFVTDGGHGGLDSFGNSAAHNDYFKTLIKSLLNYGFVCARHL